MPRGLRLRHGKGDEVWLWLPLCERWLRPCPGVGREGILMVRVPCFSSQDTLSRNPQPLEIFGTSHKVARSTPNSAATSCDDCPSQIRPLGMSGTKGIADG